MYQSGRAGDEAKKQKSPAKSGRVGITGNLLQSNPINKDTRTLRGAIESVRINRVSLLSGFWIYVGPFP